MNTFAWFLVISIVGSDELLIKQMHSKEECIYSQQAFKAKINTEKLKVKIENVTCEEGAVEEPQTPHKEKEEAI